MTYKYKEETKKSQIGNSRKVDWKVLCVGMLCLSVVEITALALGYNGTMLQLFLIIIALAIGVVIPNPIK